MNALFLLPVALETSVYRGMKVRLMEMLRSTRCYILLTATLLDLVGIRSAQANIVKLVGLSRNNGSAKKV